MSRSKLLRVALSATQVSIYIIVVAVALLLIGLVHWHFSPETYSRIELVRGLKAGYGIGGFKIYPDQHSTTSGKIFINQLTSGTLSWLVLRGILFSIINILILKRIISLLKSIKSVETFYANNIINLRFIGSYLVGSAILSAFNLGQWQGAWQIHFSIPFGLLLLSIFSYVLAEVFVEGKQLLEDKNMIV